MSDPGASTARLVWHRTDGTTKEFALAADTMRIGRDSEAAICIDEPLVSRAHAEIVCENGQFVLRDLGSTNLTRVNDCTITRCALHDGDELRFARARCVFVGAATATPAIAEPPVPGPPPE